jgi:hypothetical protein
MSPPSRIRILTQLLGQLWPIYVMTANISLNATRLVRPIPNRLGSRKFDVRLRA